VTFPPLPVKLKSEEIYGDSAPAFNGSIFELKELKSYKSNSHVEFIGIYEGFVDNKRHILIGSTHNNIYQVMKIIEEYVIGDKKQDNTSVSKIENMPEIRETYIKNMVGYSKILETYAKYNLFKHKENNTKGPRVYSIEDYIEKEGSDARVANYD